jgi:hypothetical protein
MRPIAATTLVLLLAAGCSRELGLPAPHPLTIEPAARSVSPREGLTFSVVGGAGGYRYRFKGAAGSGPEATLDPDTGAYRSGPQGPSVDEVQVVDRAGSVAAARVTVGERIALAPAAAWVAPGGRVTFVARGGLPPYDYQFKARGNRSGGTLDRVTGAYQAGSNPGAFDLVEVTDAAGAGADTLSLVVTGAPQVAVTGGAAAIEVGDLNGDGRDDLLFLQAAGGASRRLTTWSFPRGSPPAGHEYWTPAATAALGVWDLAGAGRSDVAVVGGDVSVQRADLAGVLGLGGVLAPGGTLAAGPWFSQTGGCQAVRLTWSGGAPALAACPTLSAPVPVGRPQSMTSGDFAGAGGPDVAWVEDVILAQPSGAQVNSPRLRYSLAGGTSPTPLAPPLVDGAAASIKLNGLPLQHQLARVPTGGGDGVAALFGATGNANVLAWSPPFAGAPAWAGWAPVNPFPGGSPTLGVAGCGPLGPDRPASAVAWNGGIAVTVADLTASAATLRTFLAGAFPVDVAACADVDGDGLPDLVTAGASTDAATVWLGDGDGGFGRRPRFAVSGAIGVGDVDGDGVPDLVEATGTPGLRTLFGSDHQLAVGPETPLQAPPDLVVVGPFGGQADVVFQGATGGLYLVPGNGDGSFGTAQILRPPGLVSATSHLVGLVPAELGGSAPGLDLIGWTTKDVPAGRTVGAYRVLSPVAIIRNADGSTTLVEGGGSAGAGLATQPVDLDGDGVADALATLHGAISGAPVAAGLEISVPSATGWTTTSLAGSPTGSLRALGSAGDVAVFLDNGLLRLCSPRGVVTAGQPMSGVTAGILGVLEPAAPLPALILADGKGRLVAIRGVADGTGKLGGFTAGPTILPAPGVPTAVIRLGAPNDQASGADLLLRSGDALIPVQPDGQGGWR